MLMSLKRLLPILSWLLYPMAILFGLRIFEPRYVALILVALLLLRRNRQTMRLLASLSRLDLVVLSGLLLLAVSSAVSNSELLLRLYPAAVNLGMLLLFGGSLLFPPSMIERFARLGEANLPAVAIIYTRRVTQIWCMFFVGNGALAVYTALYASRDDWALYNGCIAYLLMGSLFGGEWLFRRFFVRATKE
jgi:uncharacterized membrane protein